MVLETGISEQAAYLVLDNMQCQQIKSHILWLGSGMISGATLTGVMLFYFN